MRWMLRPALMLTLIATGCAPAVATNDSALCAGLEPLATRHAAALAEDGGPKSLATGRQLIAGLDAGCGKAAP
ncbi:hypothetical protein [Acidimangrovimonas sediminis]|uniref:hypothetical protein n=1 Tax=Acidimangrovimonas sediminis TaxID=2056283 RepID=UPI000C8044C7|nr:hypothetical protein [Acidimangrovimonas sediminis]